LVAVEWGLRSCGGGGQVAVVVVVVVVVEWQWGSSGGGGGVAVMVERVVERVVERARALAVVVAVAVAVAVAVVVAVVVVVVVSDLPSLTRKRKSVSLGAKRVSRQEVFSVALIVTRYPMTYTHEKREGKAVCLHLYLSPIF
jgi:hypothetical protein